MIRAMAEPGGRAPEARLGNISHRVAEHLGAEICSIFLLTHSGDEAQQRLVLEESFGYQDEAIGKGKSLKIGLTSRILRTPAEIVANFNVQDFPGWTGELDKELQWHCWCMLGVPIVGNNGVVKGVVKVENKRRAWNALDRVSFIRKPGEKNTPDEIASVVAAVSKSAEESSQTEESAFFSFKQLNELIDNFRDVSKRISADIPRTQGSTEGSIGVYSFPERLRPDTLSENIAAVSWYADALMAQLRRLSSLNDAVTEEITNAMALLESFSLALSAYSPFSTEDLYLMRTVAAMIAAALDIREAAHIEAFRTLEHALRRPGSNLLRLVSDLAAAPQQSAISNELIDKIYAIALYISGPQALLQGWWSEQLQVMDSVEVHSIYDRFLESRCLYYRGFARLKGKGFEFPDDAAQIPENVRTALVVNNPEVIVGALDILLVNAVEHGGDSITCNITLAAEHVEIVIVDNGAGVSDEILSELEHPSGPFSGELYSPRQGVGLKFAKKALAEARMGLELRNLMDGTPCQGFRAAIRIPTQTEGEPT